MSVHCAVSAPLTGPELGAGAEEKERAGKEHVRGSSERQEKETSSSQARPRKRCSARGLREASARGTTVASVRTDAVLATKGATLQEISIKNATHRMGKSNRLEITGIIHAEAFSKTRAPSHVLALRSSSRVTVTTGYGVDRGRKKTFSRNNLQERFKNNSQIVYNMISLVGDDVDRCLARCHALGKFNGRRGIHTEFSRKISTNKMTNREMKSACL